MSSEKRGQCRDRTADSFAETDTLILRAVDMHEPVLLDLQIISR